MLFRSHCLEYGIPFIYASSAAVYGGARQFGEQPENELPLNVYGYSKLLFDQYVRRLDLERGQQVVGLRYFNVYGPREQHKGPMASVAFHFNEQLRKDGEVQLFEGTDGYEPGEQERDFVYVDDACAVNLWFLEHRDRSGIFNVGTGRAQTFNEVANAAIAWHGKGRIRYIPFPAVLKNAYQSYTQADLARLREAGCDVEFRPVEKVSGSTWTSSTTRPGGRNRRYPGSQAIFADRGPSPNKRSTCALTAARRIRLIARGSRTRWPQRSSSTDFPRNRRAASG